jgi:hypothetical protein
MARYVAQGKTAATAATIDHAIAEIWNPSTTKRIKVLQVWCVKQAIGAADEPVLRRTSAKGTAGSTVTPGAAQEYEQIAAPPSAFTLELATFSVQPTLIAGPMHAWVVPAAIGSGFMWVFDEPIELKSGEGLALTTGIALAFPISRVTFIIED